MLMSRRFWFSAVALVSIALIGYGLVLQHVDGLEPCPMCILQRYAFVFVALFAGLAALTRGKTAIVLAIVALLFALSGAGVAAWHVNLQIHPPEIGSCGPGLEYMLSNLPLARALPRIFAGGGDCTAVGWTFLGLSIPAWALVWFLLQAGALAYALWGRPARGRFWTTATQS